MRRIKQSTWRTIGMVLAFVLILGAVIGLFTLIDKKSNETTNTVRPTFAVGGLTAQGKYESTKSSIYTKTPFECYGLKVEIDFDNNISYKLFFYDKNESFVGSTATLRNGFDCSKTLMPENTKLCRVLITPNEDQSISWFEIAKYSKQITISVNKNQTKVVGVLTSSNQQEENDNPGQSTVSDTNNELSAPRISVSYSGNYVNVNLFSDNENAEIYYVVKSSQSSTPDIVNPMPAGTLYTEGLTFEPQGYTRTYYRVQAVCRTESLESLIATETFSVYANSGSV